MPRHSGVDTGDAMTATERQAQAIAQAREWLANCPDAAPGIVYGWTGPVGFMCATCFARLSARGCNVKLFASEPVWDDNGKECDVCA